MLSVAMKKQTTPTELSNLEFIKRRNKVVALKVYGQDDNQTKFGFILHIKSLINVALYCPQSNQQFMTLEPLVKITFKNKNDEISEVHKTFHHFIDKIIRASNAMNEDYDENIHTVTKPWLFFNGLRMHEHSNQLAVDFYLFESHDEEYLKMEIILMPWF